MAGITMKKDDFDKLMRKRFSTSTFSCEAGMVPKAALNSFLVEQSLLMNKTEYENLVELYGAGGAVDMDAFLTTLTTDTSGEDPKFPYLVGQSTNEAHLALSGTMHIGFEETYKGFPKHWGQPPNAQMKGHDGIMRELPGGYGKGNAPMEKWVLQNLQKDKKATCNERGTKPYPFGNYSL